MSFMVACSCFPNGWTRSSCVNTPHLLFTLHLIGPAPPQPPPPVPADALETGRPHEHDARGGDEGAGQDEGQVPLPRHVEEVPGEGRPHQVGQALHQEQQAVRVRELVQRYCEAHVHHVGSRNLQLFSQMLVTYFHEHGGGEGVVGGDAEAVDAGDGRQVAVGGQEGDGRRAEAAADHAHGVDRVEVGPGAVADPTDDELAHRVEDPDEGYEEGESEGLQHHYWTN